MTQAVEQILGEFDQLSAVERQELRRGIVERVDLMRKAWLPWADQQKEKLAAEWENAFARLSA